MHVRILRDTGCTLTIMTEKIGWVLNNNPLYYAKVQGILPETAYIPVYRVKLTCPYVDSYVNIGIMSIPIAGIDVILGNDIAKNVVIPNEIDDVHDVETDNDVPCSQLELENTHVNSQIFYSSAQSDTIDNDCMLPSIQDVTDDVVYAVQTRSMTKKNTNDDVDISDIFNELSEPMDKTTFVDSQRADQQLQHIFAKAVPLNKLNKHDVAYYVKDNVLLRKFFCKKTKKTYHQIVVPTSFRHQIMSLAHNLPTSGHLGRKRTLFNIKKSFYWPKLYRDVIQFVSSCHTCQIIGKPNEVIPKARLKPIKVNHDNFNYLVIDIVGPLPKCKSGNQYLLTVMCATSRFPEAIPLRNIRAKTIIKALVKFFSFVGFPQVIQSDNGSNFRSKTFQDFLKNLNITQKFSSITHPESQGCIERFHQTLKSVMKKYCCERDNEWDLAMPLLLFAIRSGIQESLGYSPFQVVFGHEVKGPLELIRDSIVSDRLDEDLDSYVQKIHRQLKTTQEFAKKNLDNSQFRMKERFDGKARDRQIDAGDEVLVYFRNTCNPWVSKFSGPYKVLEKLGNLNYLIHTTDRKKKKQILHINMLKKYVPPVEQFCSPVFHSLSFQEPPLPSPMPSSTPASTSKEINVSDIRKDLAERLDLGHLSSTQQDDVLDLILKTPRAVDGTLRLCQTMKHDVKLSDNRYVKSSPYKLPPNKLQILRNEIQSLLDQDVIEPSCSPYSSPCILVPKKNGTHRLVVDYRRINKITVPDSFPLPDIQTLLDEVSNAKYVTVVDLLKGYYLIELTEKAKEISAFVTPDGLFRFKRLPFGMCNAPATFSRLTNFIFQGVGDFCRNYIDDIIIFSNSWCEHLRHLEVVFGIIDENNLSVNVDKLTIGKGTVTYLGHRIGNGRVAPVDIKIKAIIDYPVPKNRKQLMRFLGMAGYYRRFCARYSDLTAPLTDLLKKGVKFVWSEDCVSAFQKLKSLLSSFPVLRSPNYDLPFVLAVDASAYAMGSVLLQEHDNVLLPVCYFSRKFSDTQLRYSTIERELLALLESCSFFDVYLKAGKPVRVLTDHNPLVHLTQLKHKNERLLRWSITLQNYPLQIEHVPGSKNVLADAMSRSVELAE